MKKRPCVVTIAGSDSSGGAGIQADIKAISATGAYAASVITALTAQNTLGVHSIHQIPAEFVQQQINAVFEDLDIQAVKIGMLFDRKIIEAVRISLEKFKPKNIVLDPVMISKSGCELLISDDVRDLQENLFPIVELITPNIPEAEKLMNQKITNKPEMEYSARQLGLKYKTNILIKGGHSESIDSSDVLYLYQEDKYYWIHSERIDTLNTHGTGCTLSSAIASYLAQGFDLLKSIEAAKIYLSQAIQSASQLQIGHGHGPVDHFYYLHQLGVRRDI
jgi:hydroxymethylpyrimidine/phosphomethylpyrimidine kinase